FGFGSISGPTLQLLLLGGIPGVLLGCVLAPKIPSTKLKPVIVTITLLLGLQLVWSGMRMAQQGAPQKRGEIKRENCRPAERQLPASQPVMDAGPGCG